MEREMTDRLKAWLGDAESSSEAFGGPYYSESALRALRAVVELHQPDSSYSCGLCQTRSKCLTIRAIEKEVLGG